MRASITFVMSSHFSKTFFPQKDKMQHYTRLMKKLTRTKIELQTSTPVALVDFKAQLSEYDPSERLVIATIKLPIIPNKIYQTSSPPSYHLLSPPSFIIALPRPIRKSTKVETAAARTWAVNGFHPFTRKANQT